MCTVTVMVIRRLSIEGNIMMTLKLDMKHISEKGRKGVGLEWVQGSGGSFVKAASSELLCGGDPDVRA